MNRPLAILAVICTAMATQAQQSNYTMRNSFEDFRKEMLGNYQNFRKSVLEDYDKFLDGVWEEYNSFRGAERNATPKPKTIPVAVPEEKPVAVPVPHEAPTEETIPTPTVPAISVPTIPEAPKAPEVPSCPTAPEAPAVTPSQFSFYGIDMELQAPLLHPARNISSTSDLAEQWRQLSSDGQARILAENLRQLARKYNFNDYLTYELITRYVAAQYPEISSTSRTSLVHYLMANLGYDARLGLTSTGKGLLLLPCKQLVYGKTYLVLNGEKYYVFTDPDVKLTDADSRISTCRLPDEAADNAKLDLRLGALNLPFVPKPFDIEYGGLHLTGEVNANLMPIIYRYPQMPIGDYAASELMPELRTDLVKQLKSQLSEKPTIEAVDNLLRFVQSGFKYATDDDNHGFEKPYFFEETLYYDKCDCEDRVIFYSYLLWNALGIENHLLCYPGHESAAVALGNNTSGDAYNYEGKTFLISDPTYIGAKTGMCMPNYRSKSPEIDYIYK